MLRRRDASFLLRSVGEVRPPAAAVELGRTVVEHQGLQRGVKRKSTPHVDLFCQIPGGEIEMDTFPSPLASRNRPSIEEKGREGEREEKKKGREKKLKSPEGDFSFFFFILLRAHFSTHTQTGAQKQQRCDSSSQSGSSCTCSAFKLSWPPSIAAQAICSGEVTESLSI